MKLFLSGGGHRAFNLDKEFYDQINKTKPLLYIPIAMDTKKHPYDECYKWVKGYFSSFGFENIKMITDLRNFPEKRLDNYGGIYIGGGNTPYLLKELKESGFWDLLKKAIQKDIPIAGGSAGAVIFAKTIIPSLYADENNVGLEDFSAMDCLNGYEIWCHYDESMDSTVKNYMKKYDLNKIIALPEYCGVFVNDNKIQIIGEYPAYVFDKKGKRKLNN